MPCDTALSVRIWTELHAIQAFEPAIERAEHSRRRRLTASVEVENTGKRAGDEVVQLYIRDVAASRTRPVKELKGFERITLKPGEKRRVQFTLAPEQLGLLQPRYALCGRAGKIQSHRRHQFR